MAESHRTCASCGTPNEEDARFCEGCGASLARTCATCGVEATATARFCRGCGAPLDGHVVHDIPAAAPVRKTVTVMFADLAGSTTFEEKVDAETAREVIGEYHALLRSTAERHRAGVTKYIGDGFMAVWGVPEIGPDDAAHAVDAAVELQERFVGLAVQVAETHRAELALRVAVNTGEVVVGAGDADLVGDALNVGARLEAECPRGQRRRRRGDLACDARPIRLRIPRRGPGEGPERTGGGVPVARPPGRVRRRRSLRRPGRRGAKAAVRCSTMRPPNGRHGW